MAGEPEATRISHRNLHRVTLDDYLASRSSGLDLVRLVLAFLVLVSHSFTLGGFGDEPDSPLTPRFLTLGGFAVGGFFALSGLLVGRSALRRPSGQFARSRAARILPGYWVAVTVSAFGAGLIGWLHEGDSITSFFTLGHDGPFVYVGRAALLPVEFSHSIFDVFVNTTPYGRATSTSWINGSLWTLPYEMRCYLIVGLVAVAARRWGNSRSLLVAWVITTLLACGFHWAPTQTTFVVGPYADALLIQLAFVFLTGSLVAVHAHRIRLVGFGTAAALVITVIVGFRSLFFAEHISNALLVFLLPPIGALIGPLAKHLRGIDLSYGLYLYAWPVQQLVAMYAWSSTPWTFIAISSGGSLLLAAGSWFLVERPLMRRWRPR